MSCELETTTFNFAIIYLPTKDDDDGCGVVWFKEYMKSIYYV